MPEEVKAGKAAENTAAPAKKTTRPDFATFGGLLLAVGGIVGGLLIEGGAISDIAQYTAAIIVLGGTIGAVMVSMPMRVITGAVKRFVGIFFEKASAPDEVVERLIDYASRARRGGIVSLEQEADHITDPFLRKALNLAVDGTDLQELRRMLELEISLSEHHVEQEAKVFESAGGYAPTVGIIGAVLGLIQVMKNLSNIDEVGHGIAVAFVATVYGVGVANLLFLPAANKIKARAQEETQIRELILEGVVAIVEGLNPKLIRSKLEAFAHQRQETKTEKTKKAPAAKAQLQPGA